MRLQTCHSAFSLIELVAVVTLMSLMVGVTTLSVQGMSDQQTLSAAADQIAAIYRLAQSEAAATGRPTRLSFDATGCVQSKMSRIERDWRWVASPRMELVGRVRITDVRRDESSAARRDPPWPVFVHPSDAAKPLRVTLVRKSGAYASATLDAIGGVTHLDYGNESSGGGYVH